MEVIEVPCHSKKHYSPYRCDYVPDNVILGMCLQYPKLSSLVFEQDFKKWLTRSYEITCKNLPVTERTRNRRKYQLSVASKKLQEIFQRKLNYEKSTYSSGHILHRAGKIYRNHIGLRWRHNSKKMEVEIYYDTK